MNDNISNSFNTPAFQPTSNEELKVTDILSPQERSVQQFLSTAPAVMETPASSQETVSDPQLDQCFEQQGLIDLELVSYRLWVILDLCAEYDPSKQDKAELINFAGKNGKISLFNPFRKALVKQGKSITGGYLYDVLPYTIAKLCSLTQRSVCIFTDTEDATQRIDSVTKVFLEKTKKFIRQRIDACVDLNAPIVGFADRKTVGDLVSVHSWTTLGTESDGQQEQDVYATRTLNTAIRIVVPELLAMEDTDQMIRFCNAVYKTVEAVHKESESLAPLVLGFALNTSALFGKSSITDLLSALVVACYYDPDEQDGEEQDESPFVFTEVAGFSLQGIKNKKDMLEDNSLFPSTADQVTEVFGKDSEMLFCTFIESEFMEEDEEGGDDGEGEPVPPSTAELDSLLAKALQGKATPVLAEPVITESQDIDTNEMAEEPGSFDPADFEVEDVPQQQAVRSVDDLIARTNKHTVLQGNEEHTTLRTQQGSYEDLLRMKTRKPNRRF